MSLWLPSTPPSDARAVSVIHSGFLSKKGERNMFSWKKRFFTLKSNGDLIYYENQGATQSLGTVPISAIAICTSDPKSPLHFAVQAQDKARKYCMKAETADDCSLWVSKISVRVLCTSFARHLLIASTIPCAAALTRTSRTSSCQEEPRGGRRQQLLTRNKRRACP